MNILCIDTETTGTDINKDKIIEIGACLYNVESKSILDVFSLIIDDIRRPMLTDHIVRISGITDDMIKKYGTNLADVVENRKLNHLHQLVCQADYIAAHNGNSFDKPLLKDLFDTYGMMDGTIQGTNKFKILFEKLWIDTTTDIIYPSNCTYRNLTYVAAFHGFLNPFPHRGVFDACCVAKLLGMYDVNEIIEVAISPTIRLRADHPDVFSIKDKIYAAGFRYERDKKYYYKDVKQILVEKDVEDISSYGFDVVLLEK